MTGRALNGDEHTVDCDHPKGIWKNYGTQSVDHGPSGCLVLKAVLEETQIGPRSSGTVCCGIHTRAVLSREKIVHVLAACNIVRLIYRENGDNEFYLAPPLIVASGSLA